MVCACAAYKWLDRCIQTTGASYWVSFQVRARTNQHPRSFAHPSIHPSVHPLTLPSLCPSTHSLVSPLAVSGRPIVISLPTTTERLETPAWEVTHSSTHPSTHQPNPLSVYPPTPSSIVEHTNKQKCYTIMRAEATYVVWHPPTKWYRTLGPFLQVWLQIPTTTWKKQRPFRKEGNINVIKINHICNTRHKYYNIWP